LPFNYHYGIQIRILQAIFGQLAQRTDCPFGELLDRGEKYDSVAMMYLKLAGIAVAGLLVGLIVGGYYDSTQTS
jgi:hypothetical protein